MKFLRLLWTLPQTFVAELILTINGEFVYDDKLKIIYVEKYGSNGFSYNGCIIVNINDGLENNSGVIFRERDLMKYSNILGPLYLLVYKFIK